MTYDFLFGLACEPNVGESKDEDVATKVSRSRAENGRKHLPYPLQALVSRVVLCRRCHRRATQKVDHWLPGIVQIEMRNSGVARSAGVLGRMGSSHGIPDACLSSLQDSHTMLFSCGQPWLAEYRAMMRAGR